MTLSNPSSSPGQRRRQTTANGTLGVVLFATGFSCCLVLPSVAGLAVAPSAARVAGSKGVASSSAESEPPYDPLFGKRSSPPPKRDAKTTIYAAWDAAVTAVESVQEPSETSRTIKQLQLEPTLIAPDQLDDIARLARLVDAARCPAGRSLQPSSAVSRRRAGGGEDRADNEAGDEEAGSETGQRLQRRRRDWLDATLANDEERSHDWGTWAVSHQPLSSAAAADDAQAAEFADEADDDRDYVTIRYANGEQEEVEVADQFKDMPTSHYGRVKSKLATQIGAAKNARRPRDARMDLLATSSSVLPAWPLPLDNEGFVQDQDDRGHVVLSRVAKVERQLVMIEIPAVAAEQESKANKNSKGRAARKGRPSRPRMRVEEREIVTEERDDVDWYIARDRPSVDAAAAGATLTVAISSLSSTENLLELLAEGAAEAYWANVSRVDAEPSSHEYGEGSLMASLPETLFPNGAITEQEQSRARILRALEPYLERHAPAIIAQVMEALQSSTAPSSPLDSAGDAQLPIPGWQRLAGGKPVRSHEDLLASRSLPAAISRIEVVGHGLGADLALLVAAALDVQLKQRQKTTTAQPVRHFGRKRDRMPRSALTSPIDIHVTLLGPSRIGNDAFAEWIDTIATDDHFHVRRIHSYADPVAHLPASWQGFRHFSTGEHWVDADPRRVWSCPHLPSGDGAENAQCTNKIPIQKTSLIDHAGPYGGSVYIDSRKCSQ